jgi:hypothetical protein
MAKKPYLIEIITSLTENDKDKLDIAALKKIVEKGGRSDEE